MSLPKYNELYIPLLTAIQDGNVYTMKEIKEKVSRALSLTEEELSERLPSGTQTVYDNRIGWAKTYLKKAGLVESPQRAHVVITPEGKRMLESGIPVTNELLLKQSPEFARFQKRHTAQTPPVLAEEDSTETPQETFERVYRTINEELADDLLTEIMNQSAAFFENLVVDLMKSMNYGNGFVTKVSGDGIDGVIHDVSLIQPDRQQPGWDWMTIGKPEIQKFAGAMMGPPRIEKGLFITTARFSKGAQEFADAQHIILVDGRKLTELMIEYDLGVSTQKVYRIKRIDSDYFSENRTRNKSSAPRHISFIKITSRQRPAVKIPRPHIAADGAHQLLILRRLHAFGHGGDSQTLGHAHRFLHNQAHAALAVCGVQKKGAVQLDFVDLQLAYSIEGGIAAAKIVQRDPETDSLQLADFSV